MLKMLKRLKTLPLPVVVAVLTACTTVVLSMILNAWAFGDHVGWNWFGISLGILVPAWVLANVYMGHSLLERQPWLALAAFALAVFALLVSIPHLVAGYARLGLEWWQTWSLAAVTDLTQVMGKLLVLTYAVRSGPSVAVQRRKVKTPQRQAA
jgi:hypothetical protein